jgi:ferredoxin
MKVQVDQTKCCGAGHCVLSVPEVFDQREEDGIVVLLQPEPPARTRRAVRDAATVCPTGAIQVEDEP